MQNDTKQELIDLLERQAKEIASAADLIQPWDNEAPVKLAWHKLINVALILRNQAYLIDRIDADEVLNMFGYTEEEWRKVPESERNRLING